MEPNQYQIVPKSTDSDRLEEIENQLSMTQIRFLIARTFEKTDKAAAKAIGISDSTVKGWNEDGTKTLIDEALRHMVHDGLVTAKVLRRRNLAKAMAIKVAGLDSNDERISQACATEVIEAELGRATQHNENVNRGDYKVIVEYVDSTKNKTS